MKSEKKNWTYISNGTEHKVYCDRHWFLFLKLCYDDNGLTNEEYEEYKNYINKIPLKRRTPIK